jgi:hypothetical protein
MAVGGGGGGGSNEFQPHPMKEQLPGVDFCVSSSPAWRNSLSFSLSVFAFLQCSVFCLLLSTSLLPTLLSFFLFYDPISLSHSPFHRSWLFVCLFLSWYLFCLVPEKTDGNESKEVG